MLRLRPFKPADGAYLVKWFDNEEMFTKWSAGQFSYPLTRQQVDDYCRKWEEDSNGWPMAVTDETGRVVGHLLMRNMDYQENSIFFGFIVVDPSIRGKGYGKEMLSLALRYAFTILKADTVRLRVFANNPGAKACYEAVGFQEEQFIKEAFSYQGEKWDNYQMAAKRSQVLL